jgi:3-hydroxyisobutyrate dehydrogenase-like beta-hydroxyacid dehydrogenase
MSMLAGISGLGPLGRAIGERLRSAGLRVLGYDQDVQTAALSGLRTTGSPERLARECEIEIVTYSGDQAAAAVHQLLAAGDVHQLKTVVLCGALDPRQAKELSQAAAARGIDLVDAPIDGGEEAVQSSRAVIFASGPRVAVERCAPVFQACGRSVYVGEAGAGQVARLVNELLRWANLLAVRDAFALAQAAGADAASIREAVLAASGASRALEAWGRGWFEPGSALASAEAVARDTGAGMPFLQGLPELAAALDFGQLQGLFNLGIADLSQGEAEAPLATAAEDEERPVAEGEGAGEPVPEGEETRPEEAPSPLS